MRWERSRICTCIVLVQHSFIFMIISVKHQQDAYHDCPWGSLKRWAPEVTLLFGCYFFSLCLPWWVWSVWSSSLRILITFDERVRETTRNSLRTRTQTDIKTYRRKEASVSEQKHCIRRETDIHNENRFILIWYEFGQKADNLLLLLLSHLLFYSLPSHHLKEVSLLSTSAVTS